jgi:hypothetical protein
MLRRIDRRRCGGNRRWRRRSGFDTPAPDMAAGMSCHAYRYAVALDGDLGQTCFVQELCQLANSFAIDCPRP